MKNFMVFAALLLSSTQAFAFDCDPFHLRFLAWADSAADLKRTGLPCSAHIEIAEAVQEWLAYSLAGCVSGDERRKIESRLLNALKIVTDPPPTCREAEGK